MSTSIPTNVASVSKVLTTVAVLQSLAKHNISLDSFIAPYLWPSWKLGPNIDTLTFRDLLSQRSGFRNNAGDGCPPGINCNQPAITGGVFTDCGGNKTDYPRLQTLLAAGVNVSDKNKAVYDNCNFAIFRELLPFMEGNTYQPSDGDPAKWSASFYVGYMNQHVFAPVGIGARTCAPAANDMLSYPFPTGSNPGHDWDDWTPSCGGGGWYLSGNDLLKVTNDLASKTGVLLSTQEKAEMAPLTTGSLPSLGWDNTVGRSCGGPTEFCKNGDLPDVPIAIWTYLGIFQCDVPVVAVVNSFLPAPYQPYDTMGNPVKNPQGDIIGLVQAAYAATPKTGTAVCCDGSKPCGNLCCGAGMGCNSANKCVPCGGFNEPCCPGSFTPCGTGLTCNASQVCTCNTTGQSCSASSSCCSNDCVSGQCYCSTVGERCYGNGDCCSKKCTGGSCACLPLGVPCTGVAVCCGIGNTCSGGVCTIAKAPPTCNGKRQPTTKCSATWRCCGTDGWECGVCQ